MKKITFLLIFFPILFLINQTIHSQTPLVFEDFEDNTVTFTTSDGLFHDGGGDYFHIVPLNGPHGVSSDGQGAINNIQGANFFGANDIDDVNTRPTTQMIEWNGLDITGATEINMSAFFAEGARSGERWDADTSVRVEYQVDGGGYTTLFAIEAAEPGGSQTNQAPYVDVDLDGVGNDDGGAEITDVLTQYTRMAAVSGSTLNVRIVFAVFNSADEDIAIDNFSITSNAPSAPAVNLSVSANTGTEAGTTAITVTATADSAVSGNQTVDLAVTGTGITAGDYTLSNTTITILDGQTTGSVTFTVVDDTDIEGPETATLTISSPSSGLTLGATTTQNIAITDNDFPIFNAPADLCIDAGVQTGLSGGIPTGGVYNGAGVTDGGDGMTYSFDPVAAGVGVHTLDYTLFGMTTQDNVEVFDLPGVTFAPPGDFCLDAGLQTGLGGGMPTGGVYSGTGVTDGGDGMTFQFNPATFGVGVGTHTVTYTYTDTNGCTSSATADIEIFDLPLVTFTAPADLCIDAGVQSGLGGGTPPEGTVAGDMGVYSGMGVTDDGNGMTYSFDPAVAGAGTHIITYTYTDTNVCTNSASDNVEVFALPTCTASNNGPICAGDDVTLDETGGDAVSWSWTSDGSATFDNATAQSPVASGAVNGEVFTVMITDANGCTSSCMTTVTVNALPTCTASNNGPICAGDDVTLDETGGDAVSWSWTSDGSATFDNATAQSPVASGAVNGEVFTVMITDANGCTSSCMTTVTVNALPTCTASNNGPICAGDDVTLDETGGDAVSWSWTSDGSATFDNATAQSPVASGAVNGEVFTVMITDANGCTSSCMTTVTVNALPTCTASNNGPICAGDDVTLDETGGDAASWSWTSDGSATFDNATAQSPVASGAVDGEVFTVMITDANGCTSSCTTTVTVNALPTCTASNNGPICAGDDVTLDETGGDAVSWAWSSDGSATFDNATAQSPVASGAVDGEIFTVVITDANGCMSSCMTTVTVNALPTCTASNNGPICAGDDVTLDETGGDAVSWAWSSDGSATFDNATAQSPVASGAVDGEIFTVVITDANGCMSSCMTTVTVNALPTCTASNNGPICAGDDVTLDETGGDAVSWSWSSDGSATFDNATAQSPVASGAVDGEIFTVVITDANGCMSTCMTTVTVNALPTCTASNNGPICAGDDVTLDETGGDAVSWSWSSDGSATFDNATAQSPVASGAVDGEIFTVVITDANGCMSSCMTTVTVNALPTCTASNNGPICAGDDVTLDETGGDAVSWAWSSDGSATFDNATAQSPVASGAVDGEIFTVVITDANGCMSSCMTTVTVNALPTCTASNNGPICAGDDVTLDETGGDAVSWAWSSDGSATFDNATAQSPVASGAVDGEIFTVVITDANGCMSSCMTTVTVNALPTCTASNNGPICAGDDVTLDETGGDAVSWSWSSDGSATFDNATAQSPVASGAVDGEIFTVVITDANGCMSTCMTTVTVNALPNVSFTAPASPVCPDAMLTGLGGGSPAGGVYSGTGVTDNGTTYSFDAGASGTGTHTITYTYTDGNGCTNSASDTVTVEDTTPPTAICQDITVQLDTNGNATITAVEIDNGSNDACGVASLAIDNNTFDCSNIGANTVTLTVTDNNGNTASCTATVTIEDNISPTVTCPGDRAVPPVIFGGTYTVPDYFAIGEGTATDNCSDPLASLTQDPAPGTELPDGEHTITLCATDASGNEACCTFILEVDGALGVDVGAGLETIILYPNPGTDVVSLFNPNIVDIDQVAIYDLEGSLIQSINLNGVVSEQTFDIGRLAAATYVLVISNNRNTETRLLIKR